MAIILEIPAYAPGDPAPSGYLQWHAWAEVQWKYGLRQKECGGCGLFMFPQELSDQTVRLKGKTSKGIPVVQLLPLCNACATKAPHVDR